MCVNNYKLKAFFFIGMFVIFVVVFFRDPSVMISGVSSALTLCGTSVIPPLYPFVVLSDFFVRSGLCDIAGRFIAPVIRFLFRLPGCAGCVLLMSMAGGYPVGARMTAQLVEDGKLTPVQGRRMMLFCINAGPAFVIGTVGTVMLSSKRAGVIIFLSLIISAVFMGVCTRFLDGTKFDESIPKPEFDPWVISQSVLQGTNTMLMMCGWILIFSCISSFLRILPLGDNVFLWSDLITEVTRGCATAAQNFPVSVQALAAGWGGLCVHCQLFTFVRTTGLKLRYFFLSRIIHGSLATVTATLLFKVFPCEVSVFSANSTVIPVSVSVSVPAAVAMLVLGAFVILENKAKTFT